MKNWLMSLVCLLLVALLATNVEARGRRGGCRGGQCGVQAYPASSATVTVTETGTKVDVVFAPEDEVVTVTGVPAKAATPATTTTTGYAVHSDQHNRDAQGVANMMAARNYVGHFGGNPGYEGCGMASTRDGAYRICCYSTSGMRDADVGFARGRNGMWFCCRRYR